MGGGGGGISYPKELKPLTNDIFNLMSKATGESGISGATQQAAQATATTTAPTIETRSAGTTEGNTDEAAGTGSSRFTQAMLIRNQNQANQAQGKRGMTIGRNSGLQVPM